jgi:hypothetical protein
MMTDIRVTLAYVAIAMMAAVGVPAAYAQSPENDQGDFAKTMEALHARAEKDPNNPEVHYTIATHYWGKAYRDSTVPQADRVKYVQEGHKAVDKAIELRSDYAEALTYKQLLLRIEANLIDDPQRQQQLIKEADQWRDRAQEAQRKRRAASPGN